MIALPSTSTAAQNLTFGNDTAASATLASMSTTGDHFPPTKRFSFPTPSTAIQKTVVAHDTEESPPWPVSMGLGAAHVLLRLWTTAFPDPSTAIQNFTVGHDTEVSTPPESTTVGVDHAPEADAAFPIPVATTMVPVAMAAASATRCTGRNPFTMVVPPIGSAVRGGYLTKTVQARAVSGIGPADPGRWRSRTRRWARRQRPARAPVRASPSPEQRRRANGEHRR